MDSVEKVRRLLYKQWRLIIDFLKLHKQQFRTHIFAQYNKYVGSIIKSLLFIVIMYYLYLYVLYYDIFYVLI